MWIGDGDMRDLTCKFLSLRVSRLLCCLVILVVELSGGSVDVLDVLRIGPSVHNNFRRLRCESRWKWKWKWKCGGWVARSPSVVFIKVWSPWENKGTDFKFQIPTELWSAALVFLVQHFRANLDHYFLWLGLITNFVLEITDQWLDVDVQAGVLM